MSTVGILTGAANSPTKIADESASSEKLVTGTIRVTTLSWTTEKSSMTFWRSPMLRKKSLDSSLVGWKLRAGAKGGPRGE
ncbi:hypothetical protein QC762_0031130 [Podospora pseudocomata]|uniref:Uncharacterized protein n=4 Tax=Podospora TaxID=5144 RepID=A0ABR0HM46_9PEZI|nr:hypothetical protein QC761_0031430 [Podospora bellae-mahoneyi]KAK4657738.1 hypothetical protein QC762_0031130 [Podospora pseudocomata]KAK4669168.1 hypothetical protein QC763_0029740 [Podospora pseudopauciseta]KAK4679034.1 hypothetical protein QC764_0030610 [Podospora pseudoanserina]